MLRQGMIERFKRAAPIIRELVDGLAWIQNEFNPEKTTEEERSYVKQHFLSLGSNCFDESDWRLKRMFVAIGRKGRLIRNSAGRFKWKAQTLIVLNNVKRVVMIVIEPPATRDTIIAELQAHTMNEKSNERNMKKFALRIFLREKT